MSWTKIAENKLSGVSTWITQDPDNPENALIQTRQDVSALLDENQAQRNMAQNGWKGDYHSVARLPAEMIFDKNTLIGGAIDAGDQRVVDRLLNDSDYSKLRTKEGQL